MKRFLKTLALLMVSLFLVASGVDCALDHISHATTQSAVTVYSEQGRVVLAYNGDLNAVKTGKPFIAPIFFHRT